MWSGNRIQRLVLWVLCACIAMMIHPLHARSEKALWEVPRCEDYQSASVEELTTAKTLFERMLRAAPAANYSLVAEWAELGFELTRWQNHGSEWLTVAELPGQCRGQGFYLFRINRTTRLALQIPHGFTDLYTDEIARKLINGPVQAFAWNTVPRRFRRGGESVVADLGKRTDSLFIAFTQAFAHTFPQGRLIQLHGFAKEKRITPAAASAAVIVSAGSLWPTSDAKSVAACFQSLLSDPVRVYPRDVGELGGTRNIHGRLMRAQGHGGFLHVELNRETRKALLKQRSLLGRFAQCLAIDL